MADKTSLQLTFLTDSNKKVHVTISNPKQPADATAVQNAMDLIVAKQPFNFTQGKIVSKVSADEVQTSSSTVG